MSDPRVVGLDLSLAETGLCRADGTTCHVTPIIDRPVKRTSQTRWKDIPIKAALIRDFCADELRDASLVVVEAPIVHHANAVEPIYMLHAIITLRLRHQPVVRVHPSTMKAYLTGNGRASKKEMHDAALQLGWRSSDGAYNDNESDAFAAWLIGRHIEGDPVCEVTPARERIVGNLRKAVA